MPTIISFILGIPISLIFAIIAFVVIGMILEAIGHEELLGDGKTPIIWMAIVIYIVIMFVLKWR